MTLIFHKLVWRHAWGVGEERGF